MKSQNNVDKQELKPNRGPGKGSDRQRAVTNRLNAIESKNGKK